MRCVFVGCLCNTCLFKSTPVMSLLYVPWTTPSGFSMGTTLNRNLRRSAAATALSLVKKSSMPCIIQEALLSPGCTRALKMMPEVRFE